MSPAGDSPIRTTPAGFERHLADELTLIDWRALLVVVLVEPGLEQDADQACAAAAAARGLLDEQVLRWVVRRDVGGREQLSSYNRARDSLLAEKRLICLRAGSAADIRFLREVAPDMTAALDVFVELVAERASQTSWPQCSREIRSIMGDRHGTLDFTGLLPASVEQRLLPLDQLYLPLVDTQPAWNLFEDPALTGGWLVLGHPGTGKTTFVRHLAWTYARGGSDPLELGPKVPILISLSDYGHEREQNRVSSLVEFLPRWLSMQGISHPTTLTTEHLFDVLLLLDGLDELRSPEARRSVLREASDLLRAGRIGGVVITGRSFLVDELSAQDHGMRVRVTKGLSQQHIHTFVQNFVRLRRGERAHATDLVTRIERDPDLRALSRTPLILAFMVILDEVEGRLPDRRIEIYYRLGEMLVDRWTRARSMGASSARRDRPTRADALRVLGPLAWWTVERGGGSVTEGALLEEIERIEARRETPTEARRRATALLDLLRADTALLIPRPGRRWDFVHQSIGEYFAGVEAERTPERWRALLADPFRPDWREIVLFCAGQLGVIDGRTDSLDQLVATILEKSRRRGRYDAKYPSLLMGLLAESPGLSHGQITNITDRLLDFVFRTAFSRAAKFHVQREFVLLLQNTHGPAHEILRCKLHGLFCNRPHSIQWNRIFTYGFEAHSAPDIRARLAKFSASMVAEVILGPLTASLDEWASAFEIDLRPTLSRWRKATDWTNRFAIWWVDSNEADRERSLEEIWDEIPT